MRPAGYQPKRRNRRRSVADRIRARVEITGADDCWAWIGPLDPQGYGQIRVDYILVGAHRASYEAFVGPIPDGLVLDHLCRVRSCVNPDHLEPVTNRENILRGIAPTAINAAKTHCIRGHSLDNAYRTAHGRYCRTCHLKAQRLKRQPKTSPPRTHCRNGHEIAVVGVYGKRRACAECSRLAVIRYRAGRAA